MYTMDTRSILCCNKHDSLIHLFHNSTVCVTNLRVSGQRVYTIQQRILHVSILYIYNTYFVIHVIYSRAAGQCSYTLPCLTTRVIGRFLLVYMSSMIYMYLPIREHVDGEVEA